MKRFYPKKNTPSNITKILLFLNLLFFINTLAEAQVLLDFPCYTVSEDNEAPNQLFTYNPEMNIWTAAPNVTGTSFVEAIATDPVNDIIYAVDEGMFGTGGMFGTIDATTGIFTGIGFVGSGNGDLGTVLLDDIDGLTFDPINNVMYASQRIEGAGPGTEDLLFKIDVATGAVLSGAMVDKNGAPADYAVIPMIFGGTFAKFGVDYDNFTSKANKQTGEKSTASATSGRYPVDIFDVSDIAYNPYTGQLFAVHNMYNINVISILNPSDASLEDIVFEIEYYKIEGLGFSYLGELYATTGNTGICSPIDLEDDTCNNIFIFIDLVGQDNVDLTEIDPSGGSEDFESFDCLTAFNDLALKMSLDAGTPSTVNSGDTVTFQIEILNQGDFASNSIQITNYIPDGLTLFDSNWGFASNWDASNGIAKREITTFLDVGASTTVPVTLIVDIDFNGTLVNTAEISASYNQNITDNFGNIIALPDIDSQPNDLNDENPYFVANNEINQNGPNADEDEDDHDIELLIVEALPDLCPNELTITNSSPFQNRYQCSGSLKTSGFVLIQVNQQVEYMANNVTLNAGFEVMHSADFYADSAGCN